MIRWLTSILVVLAAFSAIAADTRLMSSEVAQVITQAISRAEQISPQATIAVVDREWFETPDQLCGFTPDRSALAAARSVVIGILKTASAEPHLMKEPGFLTISQWSCVAAD